MYKVKIEGKVKELVLGKVGLDQLDKVSVYEVLINSTKPIPRTTGPYQGAKLEKSLLEEMAKISLNKKVPIIQNHKDYNALPDGVVLHAQVEPMPDEDGEFGLYGYIAVPKDEEPQSLDNRMSLGVINQVSSKTYPNVIRCSKCDYEYSKDEESFARMNLYTNSPPICDKNHVVGTNGVHLKLAGLAYWDELSLVVQGAVTDARILSEKEQVLSKKLRLPSLAASSISDKLALVTHEEVLENKPKPREQTKPTESNMSEVTIPLTEYKALLLASGKVEDMTSELNTLRTEAVALRLTADQVEETKTKLAEAETAKVELTTKLTAADAALALAKGPDGGTADPAGKPDGVATPHGRLHGLPLSSYSVNTR
jgi:hypothetical protein